MTTLHTKPAKKSSAGGMTFLLVVLLACPVLVAVTGILAAVAVPAFISYVKKSKTSEATSNLRSIFTGAASYYQMEHVGSTGVERNCTVSPARSSNVPSDMKRSVDWSREDLEFVALNFGPADPVYYQYEIAGAAQRCTHPTNSPVYSFRAHGDLDADSQLSLFELAVGSDANNELYRGAGFFIRNETE